MNIFTISLLVWMGCTTLAIILLSIAVKTLAKVTKDYYEKIK